MRACFVFAFWLTCQSMVLGKVTECSANHPDACSEPDSAILLQHHAKVALEENATLAAKDKVCPHDYPYISAKLSNKICYKSKAEAELPGGPCGSWCTLDINFGSGCGTPICTTVSWCGQVVTSFLQAMESPASSSKLEKRRFKFTRKRSGLTGSGAMVAEAVQSVGMGYLTSQALSLVGEDVGKFMTNELGLGFSDASNYDVIDKVNAHVSAEHQQTRSAIRTVGEEIKAHMKRETLALKNKMMESFQQLTGAMEGQFQQLTRGIQDMEDRLDRQLDSLAFQSAKQHSAVTTLGCEEHMNNLRAYGSKLKDINHLMAEKMKLINSQYVSREKCVDPSYHAYAKAAWSEVEQALTPFQSPRLGGIIDNFNDCLLGSPVSKSVFEDYINAENLSPHSNIQRVESFMSFYRYMIGLCSEAVLVAASSAGGDISAAMTRSLVQLSKSFAIMQRPFTGGSINLLVLSDPDGHSCENYIASHPGQLVTTHRGNYHEYYPQRLYGMHCQKPDGIHDHTDGGTHFKYHVYKRTVAGGGCPAYNAFVDKWNELQTLARTECEKLGCDVAMQRKTKWYQCQLTVTTYWGHGGGSNSRGH